MIDLSVENGNLVVSVGHVGLAPRQQSQLVYWGFTPEPTQDRFSCEAREPLATAAKVLAYFTKSDIPCRLTGSLRKMWEAREGAEKILLAARHNGARLKNGQLDIDGASEFYRFLPRGIVRPLKDHQVKAALHLLTTQNAANFSVPGSGKTTVVLAVFERLRELKVVDSLFVVGPPACFGPWQTEYMLTLGSRPQTVTFAGGDIDARRSRYLVGPGSAADLYLTTFQTLQRDWEEVRFLFEQQGLHFFLVVDEAHYIKQLGGAWASAVLRVAAQATRRCILTGTPFPQSYTDAFNLFDVLWPGSEPIPSTTKQRIQYHLQRNEADKATEALDSAIGPLFFRVRKADLHLAPQVLNKPIQVQMNKYERLVYDFIIDRITTASQQDYSRNINLLVRLKRGRMTRLRQCMSFAALASSAVSEYPESLAEGDTSLGRIIAHYRQLERPAKLEYLLPFLSDLAKRGRKIVVWSNFIGTLEYIQEAVTALGFGAKVIYGATPTESTAIGEELTREKIIQQFIEPTSGVDILIANPAACAESISLHRTCWQAVYYDMSYNCAQYLQSLDRIHRVGGSEERESQYYFLQYENTIDMDILMSVQRKAERMSAVIDKEYPICSLDMFDEDEEVEAYERLFRQQPKRI